MGESIPLRRTEARVASIPHVIELKRRAGRRPVGDEPAERPWKAGWEDQEDNALTSSLAATPAQRLDWLEEASSWPGPRGRFPGPPSGALTQGLPGGMGGLSIPPISIRRMGRVGDEPAEGGRRPAPNRRLKGDIMINVMTARKSQAGVTLPRSPIGGDTTTPIEPRELDVPAKRE